ncbi:MAG: cupin domain-containing protein [Dehalococcoidia bacterium]
MADGEISQRDKWLKGKSPYEEWQEAEGIPSIRGYYIEDLRTAPLEPWERKGGLGAFINLEGSGESADSYLCEIPPAKNLKPQRHLFEETIFILKGRGATTIWTEGGPKQTFEWQEGSLFSPPINVWHQHFNGSEDEPARYLAVTTAPFTFNIYHNRDFVFNNPFVFADRYSGEEDYFSTRGKTYSGRVWESNFIPDVYSFKLQLWKERGAGGTNVMFELANNTMRPHISQFPVGTYKKAHRHGPGAHVIILNGTGYSLMWPEGQPFTKVDWHQGSMFVPPDWWFHQHFNAGSEPARYLAITWGGWRVNITKGRAADVSLKEGGAQIEYPDEDAEIMRIFESELAKSGLKPQPPQEWRK